MNLEYIRQSLANVYLHQKDLIGEDYYIHPLYVEMLLPKVSDHAHATALLHDAIEDTDYTIESLKKDFELSDEACSMLELLTRDSKSFYSDYIYNIVNNVLDQPYQNEVILIKAADIMHNLHPARMIKITEKRIYQRLTGKYNFALFLLLTRIEKFENKTPDLELFILQIKDTLNLYENNDNLFHENLAKEAWKTV